MKILILGASGFVGNYLTKRLLAHGFDVVCGGRNTNQLKQLFPQAAVIHSDFMIEDNKTVWLPRLDSIDVLINCVGIFYHPDKDVMWKMHYYTPKAIFDAAAEVGIKKIIHLSALGTEHYQTEYAKSRLETEQYLQRLPIQSFILKPSLIYGSHAQGSIAFMQALAAFPLITPVPGTGKSTVQPIHVNDLVFAIENLVKTSDPNSYSLAAVSPSPISLRDYLSEIKQWLGIKKRYFLSIPLVLLKLAAKIGDRFAYSTFNTPALDMLEKNNSASVKDAQLFQTITQTMPKDFKEGINQRPSYKADKWYAKLFFMQPLLRLSLAFMWFCSAIVSAFLYPHQLSYELLARTGASVVLQPLLLYGASALNFLIACSLLLNYKIKLNCIIQFLVITLYTCIITIKLPELWLHPFGPIVKNIPILIGVLILYSMEDE